MPGPYLRAANLWNMKVFTMPIVTGYKDFFKGDKIGGFEDLGMFRFKKVMCSAGVLGYVPWISGLGPIEKAEKSIGNIWIEGWKGTEKSIGYSGVKK